MSYREKMDDKEWLFEINRDLKHWFLVRWFENALDVFFPMYSASIIDRLRERKTEI